MRSFRRALARVPAAAALVTPAVATAVLTAKA